MNGRGLRMPGFFLALVGSLLMADPHSDERPRSKVVPLQTFPEIELRLGDIFSKKKDLQAAIQKRDSSNGLFDSVFMLPISKTWVCDKDKLTSLYQEAKSKLKLMPEKLKEYQKLNGPLSKSQVEAVTPLTGQSINHLDDVAYHYPLTEGAKMALIFLTAYYLDHGEPVIAGLYADTLLSDFSVDSFPATTLARLAVTYELTGQKEKSEKLWSAIGNVEPRLSKERLESSYSVAERQSAKKILQPLAIAKDSQQRNLFLRLTRLGNGNTLSKELELKEGVDQCLALALSDQNSAFVLELAKLKMKLGAPFLEAAPHLEFVSIKPGKFLMGSPNGTTKDADGKVIAAEAGRSSNEALHEVELGHGFRIQTIEVTQALWELVMGENPSKNKGPNNPVENISWNDAQTFIQKLNALDPKHKYRLPTEAEWEYAARAGTKTAYSFGNDEAHLSDYANFGGGGTQEVAKLVPNAWGLFDMHGNVLEWMQDWYADNPEGGTDPTGPTSGSSRVLRSGGYRSDARDLRSAGRSGGDPGDHYRDLGFRLVREPE